MPRYGEYTFRATPCFTEDPQLFRGWYEEWEDRGTTVVRLVPGSLEQLTDLELIEPAEEETIPALRQSGSPSR